MPFVVTLTGRKAATRVYGRSRHRETVQNGLRHGPDLVNGSLVSPDLSLSLRMEIAPSGTFCVEWLVPIATRRFGHPRVGRKPSPSWPSHCNHRRFLRLYAHTSFRLLMRSRRVAAPSGTPAALIVADGDCENHSLRINASNFCFVLLNFFNTSQTSTVLFFSSPFRIELKRLLDSLRVTLRILSISVAFSTTYFVSTFAKRVHDARR